MAKTKKKRNKVYRGVDSSAVKPQTIHVTAVKRSKAQQWWHERKRVVKPVAIGTAVVSFLAWCIFELLRFVFGG